MKILEEIKSQCEDIKEKKSSLEQGVKQILEDINNEVGYIDLDYWREVKDMQENTDYSKIALGIKRGEIKIVKVNYNYDHFDIERSYKPHHFSADELRNIVEGIPNFLKDVLKILKEENKFVDDTLEEVDNLLNKLSG